MKCKGGVLNYVFVIVMVISVVSTLIWGYFRYLSLEKMHLRNTNTTINHAFSGIDYLLSLEEDGQPIFSEAITPFKSSNDTILLRRNYWGGFNILSASSRVGNARSSKSVLAANDLKIFHEVGLYLNDTKLPLSLAGNTKIKGISYIPKEGLKTAYYNRKGYIHKELLFGPSEESELRLHQLLDTVRLENWYQALDSIRTNMEYTKSNFYDDALVLYYSDEELILKDTLEGYQIVKSTKSIRVNAKAKLNQVILSAPKIFVDSGFTGNLQAYATDTLKVSDGVELNYPSILCIYSNSRMSFLSVGKSKMIGEIIHFIDEDNIFLTTQLNTVLQPGANFVGTLLSDGYTLNLGNVKGNLMVDRFVKLDTLRNSTYVNFLVDTEINPRKDSSSFLNSYFFHTEQSRNSILQWVK